MKRRFSMVALMRDLGFLFVILRIRSRETKEGPSKALKEISENKYRGIQLGLKNGYYAYLVMISKGSDRLDIMKNLKNELVLSDSFILHRKYCVLFIEYLEALILCIDFKMAKENALAEPASQFYKKTLFVPQ